MTGLAGAAEVRLNGPDGRGGGGGGGEVGDAGRRGLEFVS